MIEVAKKEGKSTINWMPNGRNVVVVDEEKNNEDTIRLKANGLISLNELSDKELLELGGTSKAANLANKTSEEQGTYQIVATGPDTFFCQLGDKIICAPGCQGTSIKVDGKFYLQLGEHDVLGRFL